MSIIDRLRGGVSMLPLFDAENGSGGGAPGAGAPAAGAGAAPAAPAAGAAAAGGDPGAGTLAASGADAAATAAAAAAANGPEKFPDNWRELLAGGDKAKLTDLAKYTDPTALYGSLRSTQEKISKGELKAAPVPLPANATPEQTAAWRQANGLPEKAESFVEKLALPDGVVLGEGDKPLVGEFAKFALDKGWSQGQFDQAMTFYYQAQDLAEAQREEADGGHKQTAMQELMGAWGAGDYKTNMNAVGSLLAGMPEDMRVELLTARTPDGRMLGNTAAFNKWAATVARDLNPAASLVLPGGNSSMTSINERISAIEGQMYTKDGKENPAYWRGDAGQRMQAELRDLYDAQAKMKSRGQAAA
jgi:hypothetical protein